jgi:hypothetical protein
MKRLFLFLFLFASIARADLLTGLQAYYKLENANDSSGNALNLVDHNTVTYVAGKVNNCGNFVLATAQKLDHADDTHYAPGTGDYTFSCWFYTAGTGGPQGFLNYGDWTAAGGGWAMGVHSDSGVICRFGNATNNAYVWNTGVTSADTTWHLLVATVSRAGNMTLYLDNASVGTPADVTAVTANIATGGAFTIGQSITGDFTDGKIDEVGLWNKVLDSTERSALWNSGAGTTYPFTTTPANPGNLNLFFFLP